MGFPAGAIRPGGGHSIRPSCVRTTSWPARTFPSIEINGTFYSLQRPEYFATWAEAVPAGFIFAVKAPRYITHIRRLKEAEVPLANFLASGVFALGDRLGPFLWQLPPSFRFDAERLDHFLGLLPHDWSEAAALAARHGVKVAGRALVPEPSARPLRHALEIRHPSFAVPEAFDLLRRHRVALVVADSVAWPRLFEVTADFMYCRLHGSEELYASGYDDAALDDWASRVADWRDRGLDVFVYFDNDAKVRAPHDAQALARRLGI